MVATLLRGLPVPPGSVWRSSRHPALIRVLKASTQRCKAAAELASKHCLPCEPESQALQYMGLCGALGKIEEDNLLQEVRPASWE